MSEEQGFLHAIQARPHDDVPRLIYADWLDERDDPRGEYLRLQCELVRTWTYLNPQTKLRDRAAKLRSEIDPAWLVRVRRCTTPAPPLDVATAIPDFIELARTTVRLHPRRGETLPDESKIGGLFLWPEREAWPRCEEHDCPLVPALQLRKEDVPEVGFRSGTDLLQVLWCPHDHEGFYCVAPRLFWRNRSQVQDPADAHPQPEEADEYYVPKPCVLLPERVVEYPDPFEFDLSPHLRQALDESMPLQDTLALLQRMPVKKWELPDDVSRLYQCWLSTADGTKVGGYPDWVQAPAYSVCSCGTRMEHLISFSSWEFDGATWGRWLPIEERDVLVSDYEIRNAVQSAAKWSFGDAGTIYLFICRNCPDWPINFHMQCS
jgi:uncharacterized protein (TIGR02996 family)